MVVQTNALLVRDQAVIVVILLK